MNLIRTCSPKVTARLITLVITLSLVGFSPDASAKPPTQLCYAFLKGDVNTHSDLYVTCGGKRERITKNQDIWDFAVAGDGSALALLRHRGTEKGFGSNGMAIAIPHREIEVVSLKPDFQRRLSPRDPGNPELESSCGTVLAVSHAVSVAPSGGISEVTRDALSGERLSYEPYYDFRCSSDRKSIVGYLDLHRRVLKVGLPPVRLIVEAREHSIVGPYDMSPNGRYIAYVTDALCVDDDGKNLGCVRGWGTYPQKISVSNSGDVLFDGGSGEPCYFDGVGRVSLKTLPGYDDIEECTAVSYWRPGEKERQVLEIIGWSPQWITPEAAAALRAERSHENPFGYNR